MRQTVIVPWTEKWAELYEQERNRLAALFSDEIMEIYHIGSTSVPGIGYA